MRVQHNIPAMNSYRNYNNNTKSINKNLEKLSSGYKINRAGDDAAGLAISEKMRAQITGLDVAQKNAKDGISLVQTAEGALTEVHSMLNRMVELAEQSANGTYADEVDREQLQKEVEKLSTEIDRIADSSNFNGLKLLDGSLSGTGSVSATAVKVGENINTHKEAAVAAKYVNSTTDWSSVNPGNVGDKVTFSFTYRDGADGKDKTVDFTFTMTADGLESDSGRIYATDNGDITDVGAALQSELSSSAFAKKFSTASITLADGGAGSITFEAETKGTGGAVLRSISAHLDTAAGASASVSEAAGDVAFTVGKDEGKKFAVGDLNAYTGLTGGEAEDSVFTINGKKFVLAATATVQNKDIMSKLGKDVTVLEGSALNAQHVALIKKQTGLDVELSGSGATANIILRAGKGAAGSGGLQLQIGDTSDSFNQMNVSIDDIHAQAIGIGGIDISTVDGAAAAMDAIKDAINYVSDVRGGLGATQNRLEHTINNLSVMKENIQDAEATIRDTDVADEMMKYTKNSILVQSAQAMLAQANQQPQGVLQLLQ